MIASLLQASGRKVGRYTSPHLHTMRERISVNDKPVSEAEFVEMYEDVAPYLSLVDEHSRRHDNPRMSFFEVLTVTALAGFADVPVDAAVIEVGMGGEWDATNVIDADVAVLTPIAHDHEKWLGSSLTDIAKEKVGIIKPDSFVISAKQEPEVMEIIRSKAAEVGAVLRVVGEDYIFVIASSAWVDSGFIETRPRATTIFCAAICAHKLKTLCWHSLLKCSTVVERSSPQS